MSCDSEREISAKIKHGEFILDMLSQERETNKPDILKLALWIAILMIMAITCLLGCEERAWAGVITTEASYYTVASTIREGTGSGIGLTASGELLNDKDYTFAHATLPFGTWIRITRLDRKDLSGEFISCVARCNDRGPAARLRRLGRQIDVSKACAEKLQMVESGLAKVSITLVED